MNRRKLVRKSNTLLGLALVGALASGCSVATDPVSYEDFIKENPIGSDGWDHFLSIAGYFELVGILVKYGTINDDMVLDFHGLMWNKLGPLVKGFQKEREWPRFFEHYEYLAKRKAEWLKEHPPLYKE